MVGRVTRVPFRKPDTLDAALRLALSIPGRDGALGKLVPVGAWILEQDELVAEMAEWRRRMMGMFLARFDATPESMTEYLGTYAIGATDRVLFMIRTPDSEFVGHVGLAHITEADAELDNLMRGRRGGAPTLMLEAERAVVSWALENLSLRRVYLRVLSHNHLAIGLHEEVGFSTIQETPLTREERGVTSTLVPCTEDDASVPFNLNVMELQRPA